MISYFFGGPLADRFSARRLMAAALVATALGGIFLANIPSLPVLRVLFAYWGMTTILLFWAALIRAAREWGGVTSQGRAYGILDGGRGLLAAVVSSLSVVLFAALLPTDVASATLAQRSDALGIIIWIFTGLTVLCAGFVWLVVPETSLREGEVYSPHLTWEGVKKVMGMKSVWLQAVIVICAYVAYKATDDFSLLARDAFGYDDVQSARIGTISFWVRPFAAMGAGFLGDRITNSRATIWSFAILIVGASCIAAGFMQPGMHWIIAGTVAGTSVGIYALRGLYFALLQEARVPLAFTGSAVGLLSVVGYTPDVFMGPATGWLLDRSPGALGHQHVFAMVAAFALGGLIATLMFQRVTRRST
jgi:MFS family permease